MSDHYDGKKFFNPTLKGKSKPSFMDALSLIREGREAWPENNENRGTPRINESLGPNEVSITFVNHATFLIQFRGFNILTDPIWSKRASPFSWIGPNRVREPGVKIEDLPKIDLVIISHNHYDHLDVKTLKTLNDLSPFKVIVPLGDKSLIESIGIKDVHELDWWEEVRISEDIQITFTPTQHGSARGVFDRDKSLWGSFYIKNKSRSIYFGGDAGYSKYFKETRERLGAPEIALLGIGAYNPRWFMKSIHMNPLEAVIAHKDLEAKLSIGMHYGTFQLSSEGIDEPLKDLEKALIRENVSSDDFVTLHEGETRIYGDLIND
ncbi:conserved hypothetical protein [Halobacteriovorax marinus SJ]|uniref:Metallo-beta-lactamase domain-containing protein n=1 Tax=Halobacteriovorax marinus (strain ATCC BAA-682 / DSM 15412 / SJ) TaxID=862908 RepID=E1X3J2_HALMS|nr:MBL fold metallo-hydrolase [Halobacteriovorax marinus]CBW26921.1 conserved hypothetical protein [Halobacteriovorax marinus SJ]